MIGEHVGSFPVVNMEKATSDKAIFDHLLDIEIQVNIYNVLSNTKVSVMSLDNIVICFNYDNMEIMLICVIIELSIALNNILT